MSNIIEAPIKREDFKQFIQINNRKHIIVYATASWCGPCKKSKPHIFNLFEKYKNPNKLLLILDVDKCRDTANYLRIRGVPQLMYYVNGEPTYVSKGSALDTIQSFFSKLYEK